ncbi:hypothetical protein [Nocardioides sp.]|uniref:hypothetical protein n=1 Tax=Nocardioides sp. TaxID=35761 RepID=UPI002BA025D2|nr:hypothetical protein [Nocardioides sp.]HXH78996.1 hypothetical protein [Nocardioides sp.]
MQESELVEVLRALDARPGMLLPEQCYGALVAYIEGFVAGAGSNELDGFKDWVASQVLGRESSFHWSTIVALAQSEQAGRAGLSVLSPEQSDRASKNLIELLLRYLGAEATAER